MDSRAGKTKVKWTQALASSFRCWALSGIARGNYLETTRGCEGLNDDNEDNDLAKTVVQFTHLMTRTQEDEKRE